MNKSLHFHVVQTRNSQNFFTYLLKCVSSPEDGRPHMHHQQLSSKTSLNAAALVKYEGGQIPIAFQCGSGPSICEEMKMMRCGILALVVSSGNHQRLL